LVQAEKFEKHVTASHPGGGDRSPLPLAPGSQLSVEPRNGRIKSREGGKATERIRGGVSVFVLPTSPTVLPRASACNALPRFLVPQASGHCNRAPFERDSPLLLILARGRLSASGGVGKTAGSTGDPRYLNTMQR